MSLQLTALVAIGGIADMNGRVASARSGEIDPELTPIQNNLELLKDTPVPADYTAGRPAGSSAQIEGRSICASR
jgi:hypothetical protein